MQRLGRKDLLYGGVGVGGRDDIRGSSRPLPQHGKVDLEALADAAQRVLDRGVHLGRAAG